MAQQMLRLAMSEFPMVYKFSSTQVVSPQYLNVFRPNWHREAWEHLLTQHNNICPLFHYLCIYEQQKGVSKQVHIFSAIPGWR